MEKKRKVQVKHKYKRSCLIMGSQIVILIYTIKIDILQAHGESAGGHFKAPD
jgi:hypothetical protein